MAVKRGIITYTDKTQDKVVLTTGDQIRANREAEKPKGDISKTDSNERLLYQGYLAAKKANLKHSEKEFLDWADEVAEFDLALTEEMVTTLYATGEIDEKRRDVMLELVTPEDDEGEA